MKINLSLCLILAALPFSSSFAQVQSVTPSEVTDKTATQYKTVQVLDGKASIALPAGFEKMSAQQITTRYATANPQPKEVWYIDTGKSVVSLAFSMPYPGKTLIDEHVPKLAAMVEKQMAAQKPVLTTKKVNGHTVSRLESAGKDVSGDGTTVHSIIQLSSFEDQLLMTTFHVSSQLKDKYYPVGEAALNSLKY
ncbi:hypothetical protein DET57_11091 [Klebsiella oxytoca]|uniref:DUF1795 domain-containing protein n=1 Tax=Klebsiella oxytoca TaxID=571 RepID=A0A318FKZ5_KLEOX|nr:hypothetical protein [Klebsiella oxytoca]PXW43977.1 hypothetical protein DET57_11091 [Klebsiella oxytoca]